VKTKHKDTLQHFASVAALESFLAAWRDGTLPHCQWTHSAHVIVAACMVFDHAREDALRKIREGIRHYNECVGTPNSDHSGYHETLTRFWTDTIAEFLAACRPASRLAAAQLAVEEFGAQRDLFRRYYSFDVVKDVRARREWVPPDVLLD